MSHKLVSLYIGDGEYYTRTDVDAVIAELKDNLSHKTEFAIQCQMAAHTLQRKLRHQKYKRCLAMAKMCNARYDENDAKVNGCGASWEYISKEMKYWERWRWRWEALAEQFKEAK